MGGDPQFRAIANIITEPCLLLRPGWRISAMNDAALAIFGAGWSYGLDSEAAAFLDFVEGDRARAGLYLERAFALTTPIPGAMKIRAPARTAVRPAGVESAAVEFRCTALRYQPSGVRDPGVILWLRRSIGFVEEFVTLTRRVEQLNSERASYARRLREAEEDARSDRLTGLGNRAALDIELAGTERSWHRDSFRDYVLIFLDIDGMKTINDLRGHTEGDRLLAAFARRLEVAARGEDRAFRVGGDEFVVLIRTSARGLERVFRERLALLEKELREERGFPEMGISAGFAWRSEVGDTAALLELADERMYSDKDGRRAARVAS